MEVLKFLVVLFISSLNIHGIFGLVSTPFEDITSRTILGGLINPQGYCQVTHNGLIWDDEDMCILLQDIWGNQLYKCCREYTWLSDSEKDCPSSNTKFRYPSEIWSDGHDSGPKRLNKNRYIPVINGNQISMNSDGTFTTRNNRNKYIGKSVGIGSCYQIGKPQVKLQCDSGYVREPSIILSTRKIASLRKGDSFVKKVVISTTKSVKNTESTTISTTISMSNEHSSMIGIKTEIGEMSSNMKTVMSASSTISKTVGSEITFSKTETEEQVFTINCNYDNCHILIAVSQDCVYQEISSCKFIDPLPEFSDVKPSSGKLYYCETNERLINSESENPKVSDVDLRKNQIFGSRNIFGDSTRIA